MLLLKLGRNIWPSEQAFGAGDGAENKGYGRVLGDRRVCTYRPAKTFGGVMWVFRMAKANHAADCHGIWKIRWVQSICTSFECFGSRDRAEDADSFLFVLSLRAEKSTEHTLSRVLNVETNRAAHRTRCAPFSEAETADHSTSSLSF